jgi:hypothetical protein
LLGSSTITATTMRGLSDRRQAHEPGAVLVGVALAFLLARGAGLAAHRVADGLRQRRGAAGAGGHLQHRRTARAVSGDITRWPAAPARSCRSMDTGTTSPSRANTV